MRQNLARLVRRLGQATVPFRKALSDLSASNARQGGERRDDEYCVELSWSEAVCKFRNPNGMYAYLQRYFLCRCPEIIREHRRYFAEQNRGFGEDAMHAMWWLLFLEKKPRRCLEIGVYRGQVLSLWALLAKLLCVPCEIQGITPLSPASDAVSPEYLDLDYAADIADHFLHFCCPGPRICRAFSTDPQAQAVIQSQAWDLILIDGSHDFEIVLADYQLCSRSLAEGGLLVFDDAALYTDYRPGPGAFAGHPGPSRVAQEFARREMTFVAGVGHNLIFCKGNNARASGREERPANSPCEALQ